MSISILRIRAVSARTGLSRSSIYLKIKEGTFPRPISLGARAVGFLSTDIDYWLSERIEKSRKHQHPYPAKAMKAVLS